MTNSNPTWTEIQPGDTADADIIMDNFQYLRNLVTANGQSIANKETISNKNAAGGYCGLDNTGKISSDKVPQEVFDTIVRQALQTIYPVGSLYITTSTSGTCPIASYIVGSTWTKVGSGKVLQGADSSHAPNTTIAAGLPNITGEINLEVGNNNPGYKKAIYKKGAAENNSGGESGDSDDHVMFDASRSNSIYGNSSTVQPPAYCVNIWRRTA